MKKLLLLGLFLVAPCYANGVPTWSTGSSNRTENTTQTITRSIVTESDQSAVAVLGVKIASVAVIPPLEALVTAIFEASQVSRADPYF